MPNIEIQARARRGCLAIVRHEYRYVLGAVSAVTRDGMVKAVSVPTGVVAYREIVAKRRERHLTGWPLPMGVDVRALEDLAGVRWPTLDAAVKAVDPYYKEATN